jgi:5'-nucleotidase
MNKVIKGIVFNLLVFFFVQAAQANQLTIIYTGQTHATLFPCHCPAEPAGGVARRAAMVRQLCKDNQELLLLEAGDSFADSLQDFAKQSVELDKGRTILYLASLKMMGYDAVGAGKESLGYGKDFLSQAQKKANLELLSLNIPKLKSHVIKNINGLKIAVIGFGGYDTGRKQCPGIKALRNLIRKLKKNNVDFIILLSNNGLGQDLELVKQVKGIDCILSSSMRSENQKPVVEVASTLVAQTYWQARRLSRLDLEIEKGKLKSYNYSEIKLTPDVADDAEIAAMLARYPQFKR